MAPNYSINMNVSTSLHSNHFAAELAGVNRPVFSENFDGCERRKILRFGVW
jgi:hypothetical protein